MTPAAELREARENAYWPDFVPGNTALRRAILDAIDIALPILEADPELVERIASALHDIDESDHEAEAHPLRECWDAAIETYLRNARVVLAAISTPTPVESE